MAVVTTIAMITTTARVTETKQYSHYKRMSIVVVVVVVGNKKEISTEITTTSISVMQRQQEAIITFYSYIKMYNKKKQKYPQTDRRRDIVSLKGNLLQDQATTACVTVAKHCNKTTTITTTIHCNIKNDKNIPNMGNVKEFICATKKRQQQQTIEETTFANSLQSHNVPNKQFGQKIRNKRSNNFVPVTGGLSCNIDFTTNSALVLLTCVNLCLSIH